MCDKHKPAKTEMDKTMGTIFKARIALLQLIKQVSAFSQKA